MNRLRRPLVLIAAGGLAATGLLMSGGPSQAAAPYRLAVTFDGTTAASWLHVQGTGTAPTASLATSGTGTVTRTTWTTATIPSYVASIPGVVATDQHVGVFPAYAASGSNFAAVKVTPNAFGANDVLAPGTKDFQFGADIKFNSPLPPKRTGDNGNNVIQRGRSSNDQYKIQVDEQTDGTYKATCLLREEGALNTPQVLSSKSILASNWYRLLCSRSTVSGHETITLTVQDLDGGTTTTNSVTGTGVTNLNYPTASAASPFPVAIGAKVTGTGASDTDSDQFNGRIDNAYLNIS
jgi:hypothetical protein